MNPLAIGSLVVALFAGAAGVPLPLQVGLLVLALTLILLLRRRNTV